MSVESWARRASGLLVPRMGFANHPLGRFQPCVGPCCEEPLCTDCGDWFSVWADLPALVDGSCADCELAERTVKLGTWTGGAWAYCGGDAGGGASYFCGWYLNWFWAHYAVENGQCYLYAQWFDQLSGYPPYATHITWRLKLSSPASPLDHVIPFYEESENDPHLECSGVGTTVRIYQ